MTTGVARPRRNKPAATQRLVVEVEASFPEDWTIGEVTDWVETYWRSARGHKTKCRDLRVMSRKTR